MRSGSVPRTDQFIEPGIRRGNDVVYVSGGEHHAFGFAGSS